MIPHISIRAFVHSPTAKAAVEGALADRHLARVQGEILPGGISAAADHYRRHATLDVLIIEAEHDVLAELPALAVSCDTQTRVVVIGQANDFSLYKGVMQLGVSDYLVAPVDASGMIASLRGFYEAGRHAPSGTIYAFNPSRGGAGSPVMAHSVASLMAAREDKPVLLADLDMGFGAASLALDIQSKHKLTEAFPAPAQMDAALRVLAPPAALVEEELSTPATRRLIELARGSFRRTVLDLPSAWSPAVREALLHADEIVIAALPAEAYAEQGQPAQQTGADARRLWRGAEFYTHRRDQLGR